MRCFAFPLLFLTPFIGISCSHKDFNTMVALENDHRLSSFGTALSQQTCEGGRTALTLIYALGLGNIQFATPETGLDYMQAFIPYTSMLTPFLYKAYSSSTGSEKINAGRDVYVESIRSDSNWLSRSSLQNYNLDDQAYASSNDQESWISEGESMSAGGSPTFIEEKNPVTDINPVSTINNVSSAPYHGQPR